jgi:hypothetical protein
MGAMTWQTLGTLYRFVSPAVFLYIIDVGSDKTNKYLKVTLANFVITPSREN